MIPDILRPVCCLKTSGKQLPNDMVLYPTAVPAQSCKSRESHIYWQGHAVYITASFGLSIMSSAEIKKLQNSRKH